MTYQQELDIYKYIVEENRYLGKNIKVKLHPRSNPEIVRDLNLEIIDSAEPLELLLLKTPQGINWSKFNSFDY